MFLRPMEFQRYIQASAKRANLRVEWKHGVPPHTDAKKIVLPILPAKATEQAYREQLHFANHEVNHVLYTDFEMSADVHCDAMRSFLGYIWNGLEDVRIESIGGAEYEGDRANADEIYPKLWGEAIENMRKHVFPPEQKEQGEEMRKRMTSMLWFVNEANMELYSSAAPIRNVIEKMLSPEAKAITEKMKAGDYLDVLRNVRRIEDKKKGTRATFELAKRIFKECYDLDPEKELERLKQDKPPEGQPPQKKGQPKPKPAPSKKQGEKGDKGEAQSKDKKDGDKADGEKGKGEGKPKKDGDGEGDKGQGDASGDGDGERGDTGEGSDAGANGQLGNDADADTEADGRTEWVNVSYQEFLPNKHEMQDAAHRSQPKAGMHIDYTGYTGSNAYTPPTKDEYGIADFCRPEKTNKPNMVEDRGDAVGNTNYAEVAKNANVAFASRVRTRLQIRAKDRFEHGVKRGKLQPSLLHRVTVPGAHELNQRVFKRRITNDTLDTAVVFLGDGSGSMGGSKYAHMMSTAVQFNEAVGNVLQIPIEIHSFTTNADTTMYVHRDFATRRLPEDELVRRMSIAGQFLWSNADGEAIMWSFDRLRQRKEKRKLLIVASDGQPAGGHGGDIVWYTKQVVKTIEEETPIEIVGIGIMDMSVADIYKEHYIINDAKELEQALLSLIDKKVR